MDDHERLVILLASDIKFEAAMRLADEMVSEAFRVNSSNMVYGTDSKPDIKSLCEQFRAEMRRLNLPVPSDDTELYNRIA